jgi:hypothetical protein
MDRQQDHLTNLQAEQLRQRKMQADEKARWERHLASCHRCLDLVYGERNSAALHTRLVEALTLRDETEFHLSMPELERHARGLMDEADRTIFESHLEDCQACRSKADTLADTEQHSLPMPLPAPPSSFWHDLARFWQAARFAWPARVAVVAVLAVSLFLGWTAWRHRSSDIEKSGQTPGATIVVRLRDGSSEITLDNEGALAGIAGLDPGATNSVREALASGGLSKPKILGELSAPPIKFMGQTGSPPPFVLINPLDTVVRDDQPTLRWESLPGATSYTVAVFDSHFRAVARARVQGTEWRVPTPLHRGATYSWQVTATKAAQQITVPSAPAPRAEFNVLGAQEASELEKATTLTNSHLVLGILYAREGLRLDAERELEAVAQENPQSLLAAKLLSDVRSWSQ